MTKTIERILLLCLVAALLGSVALAADMECTKNGEKATLSVSEGIYTAGLDGADGGANGYALLVISVDKTVAEAIKEDIAAGTVKAAYDWSISDDTIQYIDQKNTASFTFKPMANKTSVVLLGGGETSPTILGVLESKGLPGDVNGDTNISIQDSALLTHYTAKWTNSQDPNLATKADTIQLNGDVNSDTNISIQDSALLTHYTAKWTNSQDPNLAQYKALLGE